MLSAKSFFNPTLFRKNLQRCWPLWFGYSLIWMFIIPLSRLTDFADRTSRLSPVRVSISMMELGLLGGLVMAVIFGIFFAMAMFSYLTNARSTQGFHAMPVRREVLFITNYLAGLFCQLSSLVLAFVLGGIVCSAYGYFCWGNVLLAFLAAAFCSIFFYSFGAFCMMFTGQILAAPVFYGILNCLAIGLELLARTFGGNFLYGYSDRYNKIYTEVLTPVFCITNRVSIDRIYGEVQTITGAYHEELVDARLEGLGVLALYALVGLLFAGAALFVYRRRSSESSSSVVAISWAQPLFKYGVAFCSALALGQLVYYLLFGQYRSSGEYSLFGTILCMVGSALLGFFAAEMLLRKSFKVWRSGRNGALIVTVVLVVFGVGMSMDLTGYESYQPDPEDIDQAHFYLSAGSWDNATLTNPEDIAILLDAHKAIIQDRDRQVSWASSDTPYENSASFDVTYYLKNGETVTREYRLATFPEELNDPESLSYALNTLHNNAAVVRCRVLGNRFNNGEIPTESLRFTGGYLYYYPEKYPECFGSFPGVTAVQAMDVELSIAEAQLIYDALLRDIQSGNVGKTSIFEDFQYLPINVELYYSYIDEAGDARGLSLSPEISAGMVHTSSTLSMILRDAQLK